MECSCAVTACRLTFLHILLYAVVSYAAVSRNSPSCNVSLKSRPTHVPCEVKLTTCDERVRSTLLFSPPVNNLQVMLEMLQNASSGQYFWSVATMHWNLPDCSESLIGFLVHVQTSDELLNECYLLSFPWTPPSENPEFGFSLPLEPNIYTVRIHSYVESSSVTGTPHIVPRRTIVVKPRKMEYRKIPALWITDLVICSNSCTRSMTISFELAPDSYNFRFYSVSLRHQETIYSRTNLSTVNGQRQGTVRFSNVTPGQYTVEVTPDDVDRNDARLCCCRCEGLTLDFCLYKTCPDFGCVAVRSNVISVNNVDASDCYLATDDPLMPTKITGIAIGCFTAAGIIVLFLWILFRPKHMEIDLNSLKEQEIFLLYSTDHLCHYEVIHCLIHFLNCHCKCSVRTMRDDEHLISQNPFNYINNVCIRSDKILLINSDGVAKNFQDPQPVSSDPLDPMVQKFLECLSPGGFSEDVHHKLTIARFDYSKINDIAGRVYYRRHEYLLMQEVESFILHVHGYEKRKGRFVYHMRNVQKSFINSPEGEKLSRAMSSVASYYDCLNKLISQSQERASDLTGKEQEVEGHVSELLLADGYVLERVTESSVCEQADNSCVKESADNIRELEGNSCVRRPEGNSCVREAEGKSCVRELAAEAYTRETVGEFFIGGPVGESFDSESAGAFYVGDSEEELESLHAQLIPPSVDSSSLNSDGTQHWSNEINAEFDSHNSWSTKWSV